MRNPTLEEIHIIINKYPKDISKEELLIKINKEPIFDIAGINKQDVIDYINNNY